MLSMNAFPGYPIPMNSMPPLQCYQIPVNSVNPIPGYPVPYIPNPNSTPPQLCQLYFAGGKEIDVGFGSGPGHKAFVFFVPVPQAKVTKKQPRPKKSDQKLYSERRINLKKMTKLSCRLKRLQQKQMWRNLSDRWRRRVERMRRMEIKMEREEIKLSRGRLCPSPVPCPLWNCPRPRGHRFGIRGLPKRRRRSKSMLSDMSQRTRTPIRGLCSSPQPNERGFLINN